MLFRGSVTNVVGCVRQLTDGMVRPCWFLSDGSKEQWGMVVNVVVCSNGLRITLDNGRGVTWRMGRSLAIQVIVMTFDPLTTMSPVEVGLCLPSTADVFTVVQSINLSTL